jgi:hypothetical protein
MQRRSKALLTVISYPVAHLMLWNIGCHVMRALYRTRHHAGVCQSLSFAFISCAFAACCGSTARL